MKKSLFAAALVLATGVANAAPITTLTVTGGDFAMAGAGGTINPAAFAGMSVDGVTYDGSAPAAVGTEASYAPTSIATFLFGGFGPVATYTAETDGVNSGFPAVSGDLTGSTLTLDLSSWTAYWNGTSFNQGSAGVTATVDGAGNFTASWTAMVVGGTFDGQTGSWSITGTTDVPAGAVTTVNASILPGSRSVQVPNPATAFATIINAGTADATGCDIAPVTTVAATFSYQTTDPVTNAVTGTPDTPADIAAGGSQSYVFSFTPTADIPPTDVELAFDCTDTDPAPVIIGLNTFLLSASTNPVADIVALAATQSGNGIVELPGDTGSNAFAMATVNVGSLDMITASTDTGGVSLPVDILICESNPATGDCLAAPAASVTTTIDANATPTFSVFVTGSGTVPFDPAVNRISVRLKDAADVIRGSTSVAVETVTPTP